jgi:dinuclear metal center YbgI/SA1388 family protein
VASRARIIEFLDELLETSEFDDYGPNGLQVPGADEVSLVATAVSAQLALFEQAAALGAQLVLCHHGLFWRNRPRSIEPPMKARLKALFDADISLAAYHLPLDAHPELGNNALICDALDLRRDGRFGTAGGREIGFSARSGAALDGAALAERCAHLFGREPVVFGDLARRVERVVVVSGGGAGMFADAIAAGADAMITGEPSEPAMADARESGVVFIAGGHYATETFGIRRLGEVAAERFGVEHRFVEIPNPV